MAPEDREPLKRLGGGRWETRDGRFTIEPESGTWVVVDTTQTNELGLPLVRGPFPSLGAAREAIDEARETGPVTSPLADELERARDEAEREHATESGERRGRKRDTAGRRKAAAAPEPPPEPAWIAALERDDAKRARALIRRLEEIGVDAAERIARDEIRDGQPALARLAIERALAEIAQSATDPREAVRQAADLLLHGRDRDLRVGWRLVDDDGREISRLGTGA